jgi:hypothetical protein
MCHFLGTAVGFGGLPEGEGYYLNVESGLPIGKYKIEILAEVPADAFGPSARTTCELKGRSRIRRFYLALFLMPSRALAQEVRFAVLCIACRVILRIDL